MTVEPWASQRLDGKLAVITGAGSGIGREVALFFAAAGAQVVASDIDGNAARETAALVGAAGHAVPADVSDRLSIERLADAAEAIAPIALWVNVAGVGAAASLCDVTPDLYDRVTRINMDGVFWGCAAAARRMIPRKGGAIINISSNAADQPIPTLSVYAMTKAAVNMLTRSLAAELGPHGIRVNGVAPGFTLTGMTAPDRLTDEERAALIARNAARSPLGAVGEPCDIAQAVLYLASDAGRFVTGQTLRVNGGVAMP
ncbi:3-oxoacyl-[acyl-carrier protein] reductase [Sphingobium wenxiniae]|uniref:NAD(P)-dependent dehydrogenase (Short-subunit alcohol dehydrogenase family) n=1 Tax=Sphingobium wenxiniae (strain DSM 21828 / CGMCC 1.7748 / JZ-1) TaxID=595605 RepID=A0A562KIC5_SPHWJ|nr:MULTISPECIES: glucose 1-dehydrogenase [Sphingobium]MBB6190441.1 3-oxoacyl-[acyl-carrier protein] reductase [Sphingobium wenxiniae]TWH95158.1 NAD(P)-dependent dehydrogenase (short-subunit alcohol dehydrogenase family) [Sphingobium wenxiniae]WRD78167.1 glucose 1-dehydrogenase [Sphingobium baderi]